MLRIIRYTVIIFLFTAPAAYSAESIAWNALPPACLPERAVKWDTRYTDPEQQASCHCPPIDYCPKTYDEYSDNSKAKMPMNFVLQCCPIIPAPEKCPDGSIKQAGQTCPVVTPAQCPAKYYPSLTEANIAIGNYTSLYKADNNKIYPFSTAIPGTRGSVDSLPALFNWSLRVMPMDMGSYLWIHSDMGCYILGGGTICAETGYRNLGQPYGTLSFQNIVSQLGANTLTWFGISAAKIDKLPNNLANSTLNEAYTKNGVNFIQIGSYGFNQMNIYTMTGAGYVNINMESPKIGLSTYHSEFINICRSVAGEYVTIEHHDRTVNGQTISCPYLQCRYVYESEMESCVTGDTKIKMADGSEKEIKDVKLNDSVMGEDGKPGKVEAMNHYQSELRVLYAINGGKAMITGDHPIKTDKGWKVITEEAAKAYASKPGFAPEPLKAGDKIITLDGTIEVKSITRQPAFKATDTYNLKIKDNGAFTANGMIVKGFDKMEIKY